jgi:hypothetical protein
MVAVSALVVGLDAELGRLGYKGSTLVWYRGRWRRHRTAYADNVTDDLPEWNQDPGLLTWLTNL